MGGNSIESGKDVYIFLDQLGSQALWDTPGDVMAEIIREDVCDETGGSCMELAVRRFDPESADVITTDLVHIRQNGELATQGSFVWNNGKTEILPTQPDVSQMLQTVRNLIAKKPQTK